MRVLRTQPIVLALLPFVTGVVLAEPSKEPDLYVSATGSDSWSGTLAEPNADESDGPFCTLSRARDAVRELKRRQPSKDILVHIRKGLYQLSEPVVFALEDSGEGDATITYAASPGEKPVFSSGQEIKDWKKVTAKLPGFCTDVFFARANAFISKCAKQQKPFFAYISTNAPHKPLHCPPKYFEMYEGQSDSIAAFYGMITNIDDNVGKTRRLIEELGIADDTIFVFTTDNGTASGAKVYNAGMRAGKGSPYDGGHRVPFFLHWPAGGITKQHDVDVLTHAVDVVPTLLEMTGVKKPRGV